MPQSKTKSIITFFLAAGIVLAIWLVTRPALDTEPIANRYLLPYPNLVSPLQQQSSAEPNNYDEAFRMYELGYHGKAADLFMSLDRNDEAVQFYRSLNALFARDAELASKGFDEILKNKDHRYYIPSLWYSALNYLKQDNEKKALPLLTDLANGDSEFAKSARELLNDLK